jgi:glucuronokinase
VIISTEVHARAGLLGNPSDMYGGTVMSFLIRDFSARVRLWASPLLTFRLHPEHDRTEFEDLDGLVSSVKRHGYYGMQRLLFAACRRFADHCAQRRIRLRSANFTLEYETNIPRQSGLGGSSAMIIAALRGLLKFHRVRTSVVPDRRLAELALSVEAEELGIAAGLQDRVVQSYGGLTYMDFSRGGGRYTRLNSRWLPRFGLAYLAEEHLGTLESGRVHSGVRHRWEEGEAGIRRVMREIARCAQRGRQALRAGDIRALGRLMNRNFDLRRQLYGDEALGEHNLTLVEIARSAGLPAKLPGSSGAALILLGDSAEAETALAGAYADRGYRYLPVDVG